MLGYDVGGKLQASATASYGGHSACVGLIVVRGVYNNKLADVRNTP